MESRESAATGAEGGWLEESLLDCAFAACDTEQTGAVPAWRIMEYLQAVTGRSGEEQQLQKLGQMLEVTAAGVALDLPTFRTVMREWIAHCQRDGASQSAEELDVTGGPRVLTAALDLEGYGGERESVTLDTRSIQEERERCNQHLAGQNATLRCALESAEELNAQLAEEVAGLTAQLHRAQQALEHGWASSQKLEDLEDEVRRLQEENRGLAEQNQHLEREQRGLLEEVTGLQETNSTLLAEAKGRKENLQALEAKRDAILQMEISSLHKLLRQTLEALATRAPQPEAQPLSTEPWREPSQRADQNCWRTWWLVPHLLLVLLLALLCLLHHIAPWLELSYLRSPPL
ncbi:protein KASH5 isoform X2 [Anser cygnoides]|uniref:protein KASH5 isoform X2 n=1 Tax=Anser cygnoides TaxID=8845 RepID=UPI002009D43F|nr:protein KASH5 isoform X2 [Anser cygnoides]